jgi:hypothetical protein
VSNSVAILAEPDRALRDLMQRTLADAGYEVIESSNFLQLEGALRAPQLLAARNVLLVIGARLATQCDLAIAAVMRERVHVRLPRAQVILTYEFGTLAALPPPAVAPCVPRGALEKPFDLYELQAMAFECRDFLSESGANVGSS